MNIAAGFSESGTQAEVVTPGACCRSEYKLDLQNQQSAA
jgi:hypothetical protein